jgi:hypothetical protein
MSIYESYREYLKGVKDLGLDGLAFKSDSTYTSILEHVSMEYGQQYLEAISEEYALSYDNILDFVRMNDKYGCPTVYSFTYLDKSSGGGVGGGGVGSGVWKGLVASPTSLRYIYHALRILDHYRAVGAGGGLGVAPPSNIVEVGCGYGGLFLAVCYFSKILGIPIGRYYMIDLPGTTDLIKKYVAAHPLLTFGVSYRILNTSPVGNYGFSKGDLGGFFISNYCFTEIEEVYRKQYVDALFRTGVVSHGFITWQTVFGLPIDSASRYLGGMGDWGLAVDEERPQTAFVDFPNYFVRF